MRRLPPTAAQWRRDWRRSGTFHLPRGTPAHGQRSSWLSVIPFLTSLLSVLTKCPHPCLNLPWLRLGRSFTQPLELYIVTLVAVNCPPVSITFSCSWILQAHLVCRVGFYIQSKLKSYFHITLFYIWEGSTRKNLQWHHPAAQWSSYWILPPSERFLQARPRWNGGSSSSWACEKASNCHHRTLYRWSRCPLLHIFPVQFVCESCGPQVGWGECTRGSHNYAGPPLRLPGSICYLSLHWR